MARPVLTPDPGVGLARLYDGLPEHVQLADEGQGWPLYRWLAGIGRVLSDLEEVRARVDYVVPADRDEPWMPGPAAVNYAMNPRAAAGLTSAASYPGSTAAVARASGETLPGSVPGDTAFSVTYASGDASPGVAVTAAAPTGAARRGAAWVKRLSGTGPLAAAFAGVQAGAQVDPPVGVWTEVWCDLTPEQAATTTFGVRVTGNAPDAGAFLVTGLHVGTAPLPGYFDGDTPSTNEFTYGWTELPYQSSSFRTPRPDDTSDLADPTTANLEWLPWMAQLVGVTLAPELVGQRARDAVRFASAGWRAGTKGAVADAAKSELTGTKYVAVYDHSISDIGNGGVWDVLIVTRPTETPNVAAVLEAVAERGAKPAGVVLHHRSFESDWDTVTSENPTWADFTESWDEIQEAGF